ncbi:HAD family hydrolase [Chlorobium sp. N1]|uniref:HAD family hydrolase n=1 Tax=Chlorobium sp. N1 TaxID=2491138 RepID=UPI00103B59A0|nr:HAD family hydrolase [Chlorobium sp. N1]TCD48443.1 HAD family hydrolase [Chlorobium sp. N1]
MHCKAVIFDMDGTLLDTLEDIQVTLNTVLEANGYPTHSLEQCRYLVGSGMRELVRRAVPEKARTSETLERIFGELTEHYAGNWNVRSKPYPGIPEMLDGLEKLGLKKAILSNKADRFTKLCAGELLAGWKFDVVMGHHDAIGHKPAPEGALKVAAMLKEKPEDILYVGDTGIDMLTATRAGMYPLGVLWGFRPEAELVESGAKSLTAEPAGVLRHLENCG